MLSTSKTFYSLKIFYHIFGIVHNKLYKSLSISGNMIISLRYLIICSIKKPGLLRATQAVDARSGESIRGFFELFGILSEIFFCATSVSDFCKILLVDLANLAIGFEL